MLVTLESCFRDVLRAALPAEVEVATGPSLGPGPEVDRRLEVSALELSLEPPLGGDLAAHREPACFLHEHPWAADGEQVDFTLPVGVAGQWLRVESPPGRPLRRGVDYVQEGRRVRFFRAPARAEVAVVAVLQGERARGYLERRECTVTLVVRAWAREGGAADALLAAALPAVLRTGAELGELGAPFARDTGVRMRLSRPVMSLLRWSRSAERPDEGPRFRAQAEFLLRGELEQLVALGAPEPESRIREVRGTVKTPVRDPPPAPPLKSEREGGEHA